MSSSSKAVAMEVGDIQVQMNIAVGAAVMLGDIEISVEVLALGPTVGAGVVV